MTLHKADRVDEPEHGNATVYDISNGWVFLLCDDGYEVAYPIPTAERLLGGCTESLFAVAV